MADRRRGETTSLSSMVRLLPDGRLDLFRPARPRASVLDERAPGRCRRQGRIITSGYETPEGSDGEVHPQSPSGRLERLTTVGDFDRNFANGQYFTARENRFWTAGTGSVTASLVIRSAE